MFSSWQWWNYCCGQIPEGKAALRINLDETSVCLFQGDQKGNVFVGKKRRREGQPAQRIPRKRRRTCLTHVAFVCDRSDLQPLLPQVIIGNEATLPARAMARLRSLCPANVYLVRQKSAWNNSTLCSVIVRWLALALRPHIANLQPVLFLDAVRLHTTPSVVLACNRAGIWVLVVPAKTTWLLQPLDTHAFLPFKAWLREAYQRARIEAVAGDLNVEQFLGCLYSAIRQVLQGRRWAAAFDANGFSDRQSQVSRFVRSSLGIGPEDLLQVPSSRPTVEQLQDCFPRNARVPVAALWRPFDGPPAAPAASASSSRSSSSAVALALGASDARWGRTRSQHRRALAVVEEQEEQEDEVLAEVPAVSTGVPRGRRLPSATMRRR